MRQESLYRSGVFLLFVLSAYANAAPLRLAIQPPVIGLSEEQLTEAGERGMQSLAGYLRDWLGSAPGVLVMDAPQYRAWFDLAMDSSLSARPGYSLAMFTRNSPLDAAIHWTFEKGKITVGLCRADGEQTRVFDYGSGKDLAKMLEGVTEWLCAELKLDRANSLWATELSKVKGEAIEAVYCQRHHHVVWGSTGIAKLKVLRPHMNEAQKSGVIAGGFFEAGLEIGKPVDESPVASVRLLYQVLPFVLGTQREELAIRFLKSNTVDRLAVEADLLEFIKEAGKSDDSQGLELDAPKKGKIVGGEIIKDSSMAAAAEKISVGRQCGALRCLAAMKSAKVKEHLARIGKAGDARLRAAAAQAWGEFESPVGDVELQKLAGDAEPEVAFAAGLVLAGRNAKPANMADLARKVLRKETRNLAALQVVAREAVAGDETAFAARASDPDPTMRALALHGLVKLGRVDAASAGEWLTDPDGEVVQTAIGLLPATEDAKFSAALLSLANHPDWRFAESARQRLRSSLPADAREKRRRELETEHPYVRRQMIDAMAAEGTPATLEDLEGATRNEDVYTRALALQRLADKAPKRAAAQLERMVADPHLWVRLHAAAVAAKCAEAGQAACLKAAAEAEKDEATKLYLLDALARSEGKTLPAAQAAVNRLTPDRSAVFLCGHGPDAPNTPFGGYYDLSPRIDTPAKAAHAAGKVFIARGKTVGNPINVLLSREGRDRCWQALDEDLTAALPWLDGVVLGEETMYFKQFGGWAAGWRLFCREAGLDAARVAGKQENLTEKEKLAWWDWEQRVAIEGFNALYDLVKLRYGKLRPGFAVCTFLPDQNGPCEYDRLWKFDIGAGYYYSINNRYRYTQIRRFKTIWPDRPVLWLFNGVSTNSSGGGNVRYTSKVPTSPLADATIQPYADAMCAWLAGAHTCNFSAYLFIDKRMKDNSMAGGVWMAPEDFYAGSPTLAKGIANAFNGVDEVYRTAASIKEVKPELEVGKKKKGDDLGLEEPSAKAKDRFTLQMEAEMKRMETGFLLDAKRVRDCARLLSDLPFPAHAGNVLLIGDISASKGALRLPNDYDYLDAIGKVAGQELGAYRLIAVSDSDEALLRDEAMAKVNEWLKKEPGLLYVRGWLTTTGENGRPTAADPAGRLAVKWPWAGDVAYFQKAYRLTGKSAAAMGEGLVFWRGEGYRGGVLFDASELPPEQLREKINALAMEKQAGIKLEGPIGMEVGSVAGLKAVTSCRAATETFKLKGVDLLTGLVNPTLATSRSAALVADGFKGKYAASFNGVAVLADRPLELAEGVDGGMRVKCAGLMQVAAVSGGVVVKTDGAKLAAIKEEQVVEWILKGESAGMAEARREEGGGGVMFLRAGGVVELRKAAGRNGG